MEAGLAIAELIAGMRKPTVSLVLGGGHSIGVPLALSLIHIFHLHRDRRRGQHLGPRGGAHHHRARQMRRDL